VKSKLNQLLKMYLMFCDVQVRQEPPDLRDQPVHPVNQV